MPAFRILKTEWFDAKFARLDASLQKRIEKFLPQLQEKADSVGDPLSGLRYFREKKFDGYRLYYLVYPNWSVVLVVDVGDKKHQQATIHQAIFKLAEYQRYVYELLRKMGII